MRAVLRGRVGVALFGAVAAAEGEAALHQFLQAQLCFGRRQACRGRGLRDGQGRTVPQAVQYEEQVQGEGRAAAAGGFGDDPRELGVRRGVGQEQGDRGARGAGVVGQGPAVLQAAFVDAVDAAPRALGQADALQDIGQEQVAAVRFGVVEPGEVRAAAEPARVGDGQALFGEAEPHALHAGVVAVAVGVDDGLAHGLPVKVGHGQAERPQGQFRAAVAHIQIGKLLFQGRQDRQQKVLVDTDPRALQFLERRRRRWQQAGQDIGPAQEQKAGDRGALAPVVPADQAEGPVQRIVGQLEQPLFRRVLHQDAPQPLPFQGVEIRRRRLRDGQGRVIQPAQVRQAAREFVRIERHRFRRPVGLQAAVERLARRRRGDARLHFRHGNAQDRRLRGHQLRPHGQGRYRVRRNVRTQGDGVAVVPVQPRHRAGILHAQVQIPTFRIRQTDHGLENLPVGQPCLVTFELHRQRLPLRQQPAFRHLVPLLCARPCSPRGGTNPDSLSITHACVTIKARAH